MIRTFIPLLMILILGCGEPGIEPPVAEKQSPKTDLEGQALESGTLISVRQIDIPFREHGYKEFDSCIINSQTELESFLGTVTKKPVWNRASEFLDALSKSQPDFDGEFLVLIRDTEGSGSIKVWLDPPQLSKRVLVYHVRRGKPFAGTRDMAYYCIAITVPRGVADSVKVIGSITSSRYILGKDGKRRLRKWHIDDIELFPQSPPNQIESAPL